MPAEAHGTHWRLSAASCGGLLVWTVWSVPTCPACFPALRAAAERGGPTRAGQSGRRPRQRTTSPALSASWTTRGSPLSLPAWQKVPITLRTLLERTCECSTSCMAAPLHDPCCRMPPIPGVYFTTSAWQPLLTSFGQVLGQALLTACTEQACKRGATSSKGSSVSSAWRQPSEEMHAWLG